MIPQVLVALGLGLQFFSFQRLWAERQGDAASRALFLGQAGWILMALGLAVESPAARLGAVNLCLQVLVLTAPLAALLKKPGRQLTLFSLLALAQAGCIPFSGFPAYFQAFTPLMGVRQNVQSMGEKLFTGQALIGTLVIFSMICQTGALGACLLRRMENPEDASGRLRWPWANVALSLAMGLQAGKVSEIILKVISW